VLVSSKDGPLFVQCFQEAYAKLPGSARDRIEDHWKSSSPSPELTLEGRAYIITDDLQGAAMAVTGDEGHRLRFAGTAFGWLANKHGVAVAVSLIVHELGHVHSWAEKRLGVLSTKEADAYRPAFEGDGAAIQVLEQLVDDRMEKWGVDPKPLRAANDDFMTFPVFQEQVGPSAALSRCQFPCLRLRWARPSPGRVQIPVHPSTPGWGHFGPVGTALIVKNPWKIRGF
jgi:hypothetical protein